MDLLARFFQGSIAQDFRAILDADVARDSAAGKTTCDAKPPKESGKPVCSGQKVCPPPTPPTPVEGRDPAECREEHRQQKLATFVPTVAGWSFPPDPPAL